jgi:hypothetical protein
MGTRGKIDERKTDTKMERKSGENLGREGETKQGNKREETSSSHSELFIVSAHSCHVKESSTRMQSVIRSSYTEFPHAFFANFYFSMLVALRNRFVENVNGFK